MRYGIIGASGTLGQVVVRQLLKLPETSEVIALIRQPDEDLDALDRCRSLIGGIFDEAQLAYLAAESDLIINLAARNPVDDDQDRQNYRDFFNVNALGAATVAAAAARHDKPLLHFSSVSVYEANSVEPNQTFTEESPLPDGHQRIVDWYQYLVATLRPHFTSKTAPQTIGEISIVLNTFFDTNPLPETAPVYGLSKLAGEQIALEIAPAVLAVRMSDVYGPGHESRGVITEHLGALAARRSVTVDFGFRRGIYFLYIDDVGRLIATCAARRQEFGRLPNIVNFVGERVDETTFASVLRSTHGDAFIALGKNHKDWQKADRQYARSTFDHNFAHFGITSLTEGIRKTVGQF